MLRLFIIPILLIPGALWAGENFNHFPKMVECEHVLRQPVFRLPPIDNILNSIANDTGKSRENQRTDFSVGEIVWLGFPNYIPSKEDIVLIDAATDQNYTLSKEALPWFARLIRRVDDFHDEVEVVREADYAGPKRFVVSHEHVYATRIGRPDRLEAFLEITKVIYPDLKEGERVRYRGEDGLMRPATLIHEGAKFAAIKINEEVKTVLATEIFKSWGPGRPTSVTFDMSVYHQNGTESMSLEKPADLLREYLDAAARLSSHPEFQALALPRKIQLLLDFQQLIIPWNQFANNFEDAGIADYQRLLCAGSSLCRHNTPLFAAVLSEAGIQVRVVRGERTPDDLVAQGNTGDFFENHTWLEVELRGQTFIVDPTSNTIKSLDDASRDAVDHPKSSDAIWWTNPKRMRNDLIPLLPRP